MTSRLATIIAIIGGTLFGAVAAVVSAEPPPEQPSQTAPKVHEPFRPLGAPARKPDPPPPAAAPSSRAPATPSASSSAAPTDLPSPAVELPWLVQPLGADSEARQAAELSCARGTTDDCMRVGAVYSRGTGVTADPAKARFYFGEARKRYSLACENHDPVACLSLSHMFATGTGVPKDEANGQALREHAKNVCKLADHPVCEKLK